jgi:NADH-quinone oxidoreductase subunit N
MLLYGMSILYGMSGSLNITEVGAYLAANNDADIPLLFGLSFVIVGLAFKLGTAPFHMWLPDVYQGAPTSVTLYIKHGVQDRGVCRLHAAAGGRPERTAT